MGSETAERRTVRPIRQRLETPGYMFLSLSVPCRKCSVCLYHITLMHQFFNVLLVINLLTIKLYIWLLVSVLTVHQCRLNPACISSVLLVCLTNLCTVKHNNNNVPVHSQSHKRWPCKSHEHVWYSRWFPGLEINMIYQTSESEVWACAILGDYVSITLLSLKKKGKKTFCLCTHHNVQCHVLIPLFAGFGGTSRR